MTTIPVCHTSYLIFVSAVGPRLKQDYREDAQSVENLKFVRLVNRVYAYAYVFGSLFMLAFYIENYVQLAFDGTAWYESMDKYSAAQGAARWLLHPMNDGKGYCDPSARIAHQLVIADADACKQLCLQTESCNYACWQDQYGGQCHLTPTCESFTARIEATTWRKVAPGAVAEVDAAGGRRLQVVRPVI